MVWVSDMSTRPVTHHLMNVRGEGACDVSDYLVDQQKVQQADAVLDSFLWIKQK